MYGLPMFQVILCFLAFILHIIAISTSYWTNFYAKNEFGVLTESGHLGLWLVCYNEPGFPYSRFGNGYGREYCDVVDTMFRTPPFLSLASVLAVVATLAILLYFPFAIMKQKYINSPYASKSSVARYSGAFKLAIATIAAILTVLVMIFVSVREQELGTRDFVPIINFRGYWVTKSWSFYLEAIVALILLVLAMLSLMENNRTNEDSNVINNQTYPTPYNIQQAEIQKTGPQTTNTLPRGTRTRNEYVDSVNSPNHNLRLPHASQNSISGQADGLAYSDRTNEDDDIDQIDEDTASPLEDDLTKLNKHIRRSSRYPATSKSPTIHKATSAQPLTSAINSQPFSYHIPRSPSLNRNLTKSSSDIRPSRSSSAKRNQERRNSLERNDKVDLPISIPINTYRSSPSQRAYYDSTSPFSPINNYEFNSDPIRSDSPLLPNKSIHPNSSLDNQPQLYRTRFISTETTTETTQSTTLKRPQTSPNLDKSSGTIRYHNIDLDPIDR